MNVLFLEPEVFSDWAVRNVAEEFRLSSVPEQTQVLFVRIGRRIGENILRLLPRLRVLVSVATGVDHIDYAACQSRNVEVLTLKGEHQFLAGLSNTSEHAFALLLALYRRLLPAHRGVLEGHWEQSPYRGHTLRGKTFGIVGYGRLGRFAAEIAGGFGMHIIAYDPEHNVMPAGTVKVDNLIDLAAAADVLSLHADLNELNHGMIDESVLRAMPANAVLVNTARGQLIQESALLRALEEGWIAGAALDVLADEAGFGKDHPLLSYARTHDNLVLTPHIGGQTYEAVEVADKFMVSKLKEWCKNNAC